MQLLILTLYDIFLLQTALLFTQFPVTVEDVSSALSGVSTCTKCHDSYHEGITCEQNKDSKEKSKELDEWMHKNRKFYKRCPKYNIPIEKNKGCNHIHCRQYSADICWVCLKHFDTPNDCYNNRARGPVPVLDLIK